MVGSPPLPALPGPAPPSQIAEAFGESDSPPSSSPVGFALSHVK